LLGMDVTPTYDAATHSLKYDLNWTHALSLPDLAINLGLDLGDLKDVATGDFLDASGNNLVFDLTFGINLAARAPFTLSPPLPVGNGAAIAAPANGQLVQDLAFDVILNNDPTKVVHVTVPKANTTTNTSPSDLRDDVQQAVDQAILSGASRALGFNYFNGNTTPGSSVTADRDFNAANFTGTIVFALTVNKDAPVPVRVDTAALTSTHTGIDAAVDKLNQALALKSVTLDGSSATVVDLANNRLSNSKFSNFNTGDQVVYHSGGDTPIGGLV